MGEADRAFDHEVARLRPELLAHGYRMTGSLADAEAALHDALARQPSGPSTGLYRVLTTTCLDLVAARRARSLPELVHPPGVTAAADDPPWLEPFPDALLGSGADRATVRIAFVAALQALPPRQRAALLLCDVVGLSAEDIADTLATSAAAVTSALHAARGTLAERARPPVADDSDLNVVLTRYVGAWEAGDTGTLSALLHDDAILSMPPMPLWVQGARAIVELLTIRVFSHGTVRLIPTWANGVPAFGVYEHGALSSLSVVDFEGDRIAALHAFLVDDSARTFEPARFGLAPQL